MTAEDPGPVRLDRPMPRPSSGATSATRVVLVVLGALLALAGVAVAAVGLGLLLAESARTGDGFLMTGRERLSTETAALATEPLEVRVDGPRWLEQPGRLATLRVEVESSTGEEVFVGVGPRPAVEDWLGATAFDRVRDVGLFPFWADHSREPGRVVAVPPPGEQELWAASASGPGRQAVSWPVTEGDWVLVAANADGSTGVDVLARAGVHLPVLGWAAVLLVAGGVVLLAVGILLVVLGVRYRG